MAKISSTLRLPKLGRGTFRIKLTDGAKPLLLFDDPSEESLLPIFPFYYAGGSRIVWAGQENGQNNSNLWSADANGKDIKLVLDAPGHEFLMGVLD